MWGFLKALGLVLLLSCLAHADVGLMLAESTGVGMSRWTSAGHSAVYLSRVCADTPIHLRLCAPGEQGIVLNNYINLGEDKPYEWNAISLNIYLYGVEDPADRPLYASPELRAALQERFREKYLGLLCPEGPCTDPKAHWRDIVATNFVRDVYMFEVATTEDQDRAFIAKFNALPNVDHYNGMTRNCADFSRLIVNSFFPGAAKPDHLNDFWMTSPKAISKSFTHYAVRHHLPFHVIRYTQIPGSYRHSGDARKGTELAFRAKKWLAPMLMHTNELVLFTASYMLTGRFNPELELRRRPDEHTTEDILQARHARHSGDLDLVRQLRADEAERRHAIFGTKEDWSRYSDAFQELRSEAAGRDLSTQPRNAKEFAAQMEAHGHPEIDNDGSLWINYDDGSGAHRIGISASNVNSPDSDAELAYSLLLARTASELENSPKNREMLPQFHADWQLLQDARTKLNWKILARQLDATPSSDEPDASGVLFFDGPSLLP